MTIKKQDLGRMAFQSPEALVIIPQTLATPQNIGDLVIQATSNTSLVFKYRGTDGVVRSSTLTLA